MKTKTHVKAGSDNVNEYRYVSVRTYP